jgi:hypothetical protein
MVEHNQNNTGKNYLGNIVFKICVFIFLEQISRPNQQIHRSARLSPANQWAWTPEPIFEVARPQTGTTTQRSGQIDPHIGIMVKTPKPI